jgi:hypothetical protein
VSRESDVGGRNCRRNCDRRSIDGVGASGRREDRATGGDDRDRVGVDDQRGGCVETDGVAGRQSRACRLVVTATPVTAVSGPMVYGVLLPTVLSAVVDIEMRYDAL